MKTKILPLFFFSIVFLNTKAQTSVYHPFPDSNAVWNGSCLQVTQGLQEDYSYILKGDTMIGSNNYHKIYIPFVQKYGDTSIAAVHLEGYQGAIRQDTVLKQVYFVQPGNSSEYLLYDFSLKVGDSVAFYTQYGASYWNSHVLAIDSTLVGSNYRKTWSCGDPSYYGWYYVEGVGSAGGLLDIQCSGMGCNHDYVVTTECFTQNNTIHWPALSTIGCDIISSVKNIHEEKHLIDIFPNPLTSSSTLQFTSQLKDAEVIIYDMLGKEMMRKRFSGNEIQLEKGSLVSGVYFVRVRGEERFWVEKIVME